MRRFNAEHPRDRAHRLANRGDRDHKQEPRIQSLDAFEDLPDTGAINEVNKKREPHESRNNS